MKALSTAYFDAYLLSGLAPAGLSGGIVYGEWKPEIDARFLRAKILNSVIGPGDERYPRAADVVDLQIPEARLLEQLKQPPAHWWPLCGAVRKNGQPTIIHVSAPELATLAKGLSKLARAFSSARFLIDPFLSGKDSNWKAGVCLADEPNIWISTRGLYGGEALWEKRAEREAFHFIVGEVGAGKVLFASGGMASAFAPAEWLESIPFLDAAQRALILRENALEALALRP